MKSRRIYHPVRHWPDRVRLWTFPWGSATLACLAILAVGIIALVR